MTLSGKQRRDLKALGQTMTDDVQLGKAGLTPTFIAHAQTLLARKELVKVRFTDVEGEARGLLAEEIGTALGAEVVGVVGRTTLLYKPNPQLDAAKRALRD